VPRVWAYVFVETENPGPKRVVREIRKLEGVVRAEIDRIAELPGVVDTDSKVARWIE
jgi:hypothetical protein